LIKPVGCTNTIILQLHREAGVEIPPAIAGIMLTAILSYTLAFRSPTTTDLDHQANSSDILILGSQQDKIAQAFNLTLDYHSGWTPGVVSRKK